MCNHNHSEIAKVCLLIIYFDGNSINLILFRLLVASQNGYMYIYSIPLDGGECSLLKKHGKFNINCHFINNTFFLYLDLKNVDQHDQKRQESAPINIAEN